MLRMCLNEGSTIFEKRGQFTVYDVIVLEKLVTYKLDIDVTKTLFYFSFLRLQDYSLVLSIRTYLNKTNGC